jgi:cell wall-associated NlpC family hydrolase
MGLRRYNDIVARLLTTIAVMVMLTGCASRGAVPRPFPGAATPGGGTSPAPSPGPSPAPSLGPGLGQSPLPTSELIATALALRGTQYRNGGSEPSRGFDCSGLVQWVFAQHGASLPRETREQYEIGEKIDEDEVQAGDLVFFETVSKGPSHVGIALGGGEFVHAPSSRGVVRVESYKRSEYWSDRWLGARRIALLAKGSG